MSSRIHQILKQIILLFLSVSIPRQSHALSPALHGVAPFLVTAAALGSVLVSFAGESPSNPSNSQANDQTDRSRATQTPGVSKQERSHRRQRGSDSHPKRRGNRRRGRLVTASDVDAAVDIDALRSKQFLQEQLEDPLHEKEEYETSPRIPLDHQNNASTARDSGLHYQKQDLPVDIDYLTASSYQLRQHHSTGGDALSQRKRVALFSASSGATNSNGEEDQSLAEDTSSAVAARVNSLSTLTTKQPVTSGAPAVSASAVPTPVPAGNDGDPEKPAVADVSDIRSLPPRVRLCDVPPVFFPRPSRELAELAAVQVAPERAEERAGIEKVYPFGVPLEVRSVATGARLRLVFHAVLGSGGQGIVLLARDATGRGPELALKIFRLSARRQRGYARDNERLQRRVRLETAILRAAPVDLPPSVWSQAAHVVMPLDVVEPLKHFPPPPGDKTKYWNQWVVFEKFAGDLAFLRDLPHASSRAKLSATKQMTLSVGNGECVQPYANYCGGDSFLERAVVDEMGLSCIKISSSLTPLCVFQPVGHFSHCLEGTVKYLPPENFRCLQRNEKGLYLSPLKDSWALGVVLFKVWCYNILPYGIDGLKEDDVAEVISSVHINDLDLSECSSDTPVAVLHLLRLLLEPNVSLRATPRSLLERHPVFTMPPSSILGETLEDLVYTMKQKTAER